MSNLDTNAANPKKRKFYEINEPEIATAVIIT